MPLVSSREAAKKRSERAAADAKELRRRDSYSSLPMTIDSSTKATQAKAMRRRSARRDSIASFKAKAKQQRLTKKENTPPRIPKSRAMLLENYSPPVTRSAKKARFDGDDTQSLVLNFSPPDQEENEKRERNELELREMAREHRVQQLRSKGQLLQFSPTNRHMGSQFGFDDENEAPPAHTSSPSGRDVAVPDTSPTEASNLTDPQMVVDPQMKEMLEQMNGRIAEIASKQGSDGAAQEQRNIALMATNTELKDSNQALENEVELLSKNRMAEKEQFLVEKTRLESQLEAEQEQSRQTMETMEEARTLLETQVRRLGEDKQELKEKVIGLQKDLGATQEKLEDAKAKLHDLSMEANNAQQQLEAQCRELQDTNVNLGTELAEKESNCTGLQRQVASLKKAIADMETGFAKTTSDLDEARASLKEKDSALNSLGDEKTQLETRVRQLQDEIIKMQQQNGKERDSLEQLHQEGVAEMEQLLLVVQEKDKKIGELFKQLGDLQKELHQERLDATQNLQAIDEAKKQLEAQVLDLEQALENAAGQVDGLEAIKNDLDQELTTAQQEIANRQADVKSLENKCKESEEKSTMEIETLNTALKGSMGQVEELEAKAKTLQQALTQTKGMLEESETLTQSLQHNSSNQVQSLTQELEDVSKKMEESGEALAAVRMDLEEAHSSNTSERLKREEAERRIVELEMKLRAATEERNEARANMQGFDEREEDLYNKIRQLDHIRRIQHGKIMQLMGNIRVFVRVRPALEGEAAAAAAMTNRRSSVQKRKRAEDDCAQHITPFQFPVLGDASTRGMDASKHRIKLQEPPKDRGGLKDRRKTWDYAFDNVFTPHHGQEDVWESTEPMVQCAVDGYNVTLFAYGQTGSGKTHTMLGEEGNEGIIARSVKKLFGAKAEMEGLARDASKVSISVELLEVYNEKVRDLLAADCGPNGEELIVKVTSQEVVGNTVVQTTSEEQVLQILDYAQGRRCVKATASNAESSRSHMLFTIHFDVEMSDGTVRNGKLNVCDLAGSERLSKSGANNVGGALLEETKHINKSLSVLSNVIERLQAGDKNVPFRESKLTFLLKDSLSGNSKTLAIVCCNPLSAHVNESLSTLRFAAKVNRVDLKAVANFSC